ncbi:hypothetical protein A4X13_0g7985 [Tilletia indica]|uniref:Uncharacterized protein n=1 Tax=Tilletia indica TaxID=43049 RepID=A0A177T107_9BASI|nr:hypothetical protein A4X13_0g7985 [Tilletia indica]
MAKQAPKIDAAASIAGIAGAQPSPRSSTPAPSTKASSPFKPKTTRALSTTIGAPNLTSSTAQRGRSVPVSASVTVPTAITSATPARAKVDPIPQARTRFQEAAQAYTAVCREEKTPPALLATLEEAVPGAYDIIRQEARVDLEKRKGIFKGGTALPAAVAVALRVRQGVIPTQLGGRRRR